ncbi:uncharacterized protein HMPREF1541_03725 [Cyphellophora europaea CBS 101466]|uniref:Uncharacterized protein n=1 Tax=Cyphellophora europaea (strain CBS 101466) TaxID=1220924 RepID=W2S150_CYPE1|nr:uncharacterized protein HMPREF1541_03725 [Cyphellophora europaea CBS 101466]ETN41788.1 hypothetical protein HMPREF1541_03725 [Cyphellophora europaea CBS 101466]
MTRIPLSIDDQISPYIGPANGGTGSDPVAWIAIIFAAFFVIVTAWHCILLVRRQAYFTWLMVASSLAQCLSLVEFAYSTIYPLSTPFLVIGTLTHWLSPTLLTISVILVFGRASWAGALSNPSHVQPLWGFLRWNTVIITTTSLFNFSLLCIGCIIVVASAPDAKIDGSNNPAITAGYGLLKTALVLQLLLLTAFALFVWRFRNYTLQWDVEWNQRRKFNWTWKKLLVIVLVSLGLLLISQLFHLIIFFMDWTDMPWLGLLFDSGPVFIVTLLFLVYHPGRCLPKTLTKLRLDKERLRLATIVEKELQSKNRSDQSLASGST